MFSVLFVFMLIRIVRFCSGGKTRNDRKPNFLKTVSIRMFSSGNKSQFLSLRFFLILAAEILIYLLEASKK